MTRSARSDKILQYASLSDPNQQVAYQRTELYNPHNATCLSICRSVRFVVRNFNNEQYVYERTNQGNSHMRPRRHARVWRDCSGTAHCCLQPDRNLTALRGEPTSVAPRGLVRRRYYRAVGPLGYKQSQSARGCTSRY